MTRNRSDPREMRTGVARDPTAGTAGEGAFRDVGTTDGEAGTPTQHTQHVGCARVAGSGRAHVDAAPARKLRHEYGGRQLPEQVPDGSRSEQPAAAQPGCGVFHAGQVYP